MNLFSYNNKKGVVRELLKRRRQLANLDKCFDYKPTVLVPHEKKVVKKDWRSCKTKIVTLPGSYKGGSEIREMYLKQIKLNEKFFNNKDY